MTVSSQFALTTPEFSEDRTNTLSYYLGDPFGNEVDGRSQVVATEVSDVIDS